MWDSHSLLLSFHITYLLLFFFNMAQLLEKSRKTSQHSLGTPFREFQLSSPENEELIFDVGDYLQSP